jgi:sugar lactone lactonase YvrE
MACRLFVVVCACLAVRTTLAQSLSFSTLAGNAGYGSADGMGASARFNYPQGVAADSAGNIYLADSQNSTIRKITPLGVVSTFAGLAGSRGATDGDGASARFASPRGVAADALGNLYVSDTLNHTIRMMTPAGAGWLVTTLAGQAGVAGAGDGTGTNATFRSPGAIAADHSGRLYVADTYNDTLRLMTPAGTNWVVTTLAGSRGVAGKANGTNTAATFSLPSGIAVDASNNVFVADTGNSEIREIVPVGTNWAVSTLANVNLPGGIAINGSNNLVVADSVDDTVLNVTYSGTISTLAGTSGVYGGADGTNAAATFNYPQGTAVDANGVIYVADSLNNTVRKIAAGGVVTTFAGLAGGLGGADGTNSVARFQSPQAVAFNGAGNIYVADAGNDTIRRVSPLGTNWQVTTLAGQDGSPGNADGTNAGAQFYSPGGIAVDGATNLYVADSVNNEIRKITPVGTNWVVTTLAGRAGAFYSGNITNTFVLTNIAGGMTNLLGFTNVYFVLTNSQLVTNYSGLITNTSGGGSNLVFVVTNVPSITVQIGGVPTLVNLTPGVFTITNAASSLDGPAALALFSNPSGIALDNAGDLYIADRGNNTIRLLTTGGTVSTFAGSPLTNGFADGTGAGARFHHPSGVSIDAAGNLYVADTDNDTIRKITTGGAVTTLAGAPGVFGSTDGTNKFARFDAPQSLAVDTWSNLYVADTINSTIRRLTPSGTNWIVTTVGGVAGTFGSADGVGTNALFHSPGGLAVDAAGDLYVADTLNNTIRFGLFVALPPPTLGFIRLANQLVLSWPATYSGFVLEESSALGLGASWVPVGGGTTFGTNLVSTNSTAGPAAFFRLRKP